MNPATEHVLCGRCAWRADSGHCTCPKIHERETGPECGPDDDHLVYSYNEGGSFWVGPQFGCVHGVPMPAEQKPVDASPNQE